MGPVSATGTGTVSRNKKEAAGKQRGVGWGGVGRGSVALLLPRSPSLLPFSTHQ